MDILTQLKYWNDTDVELPNKPVYRFFEEQAELQPDSVALIWSNGQLTYRQLNAKANRLANYLKRLGIKTEDTVALLMEQSEHVIVAILAVMKVGGVSVPIASDYPLERINFMLRDSGCKLILSHTQLRDYLNQFFIPIEYVNIEEHWLNFESANLTEAVTLENRAIIFYTSGSTGKPKGVQVLHKGILRLVYQQPSLKLNKQDVMAQIANIGFDAATWEIWNPLVAGARLAIIPKALALFPLKLIEEFEKFNVSATFLTVSYFNLIAQECPHKLKNIKYVFFGGEKADISAVRKVIKHGKPLHLINGYGPTEATTFAIGYEVLDEMPNLTSVPIGRPIANTSIYIVDEQLNNVPIGQEGEILIGGAGVALGYLNRPDLNAERFIPNHFTGEGMLYRTGDIGKFFSDGIIEYIGRADLQVKIRGFRIELSEIEYYLKEINQVKDVAVIARETHNGKELIAFWVPANNIEKPDLRKELSKHLPNYMIPKDFIELDALPLNQNGKVNRIALAQLKIEYQSKDIVIPETENEQKMLLIWQKVLQKKEISVIDDFMQVGGNSLLGINCLLEVERQFQVSLPISILAIHGNIRALTKFIESGQTYGESLLVPLQKTGNLHPLIIFGGGGANLLYLKPFSEEFNSERPVYGLRLADKDGREIMGSVLEYAELFAEAIKNAFPNGPYHLVGHSMGGLVALEVARILNAENKQSSTLMLLDTSPPGGKMFDNFRVMLGIHRRNFVKRRNLKYRLRYVLDVVLLYIRESTVFNGLLSRYKAAEENILLENIILSEKYNPEPYLGDVFLFQAGKHAKQKLLKIEKWQNYIIGHLETITIPGNHMSILNKPNTQVLAAEIKKLLSAL